MKIQSCSTRTVLNNLENFLFAPQNPYYTTLFRVILSIAVPVVFWDRSIPLSFIGNTPSLKELYARVFFTIPYSITVSVFLIIFCMGIKSRIFGFLLFILLVPLIFVDGYYKSRQVIAFSVLAFSLIPSGSQYSLIGFKNNLAKLPSPVWPIRLIQLQLSLLYLVNAIAKTTPGYLDGEVLKGQSIMMPNFLINLSDGYLHLGPVQVPVYVAAISSVLTEYTLAIGFWFRRTRIPTAVLGVVFHFSLMYVITIGKLDWASMFLYPAFLLPIVRKS